MSPEPTGIAACLPNYAVGDVLGRGGFGVVYGGRHLRLDRLVAIKELPALLFDSPSSRARFVTEARVLASLDHPHIVPVYDYVEQGDRCLLVMEYLAGGTVWDWFQAHGISAEQACAIGAVTAAALQHAHDNGVLHRDVKPENLLVSESRQIKLTDFGIAKVVGGNDTLVTSDGVIGTPVYMAPEQAEGADLTPAVDVYAAGVMLYELLSGRLPYSDEGGGLAILYRHVHEQPEPLRTVSPEIPEPLNDAVMRALARSPSDRYGSAQDFGVAIGEAASACFGAGWFTAAGVPVMSPGPIQTSLETLQPPWRQQVDQGVRQPETVEVDGQSREKARLTGAQESSVTQGPGAAGGVVVRPEAANHRAGEGAVLADEPPVPVRQLRAIPKFPWVPALVALGAAILIVLTAFLGWASTAPKASTLPSSAVLVVAGHNVTDGGSVKLDLSKDVPVQVTGVPNARAAQLDLSVLGARLASGTGTLTPAFGGVVGRVHLTSTLASPRYMVPGPVEATLHLAAITGDVGSQEFTMGPSGTGFLTLPGIIVIVLILFVAAYVESLLRPLRKLGRWRTSSGIGLAIIGALGGVTVVGLAWVLGSSIPTYAALVICGLLGAVSTIALGVTVARNGLRGRLRRIARKQGVVAI